MPNKYSQVPGHYGKIELDVNASISRNEYDSQMATFPSWSINEMGIIDAFKSSPPNPDPVSVLNQTAVQKGEIELFQWCVAEPCDQRLIVVLDGKGRLAALGYPWANFCMIFERMVGDRIRAHEHATSIISEGLWSMVMTVALVNTSDGWGIAPGMSCSAMFQQVHMASNSKHMTRDAEIAAARMARGMRGVTSGARAA